MMIWNICTTVFCLDGNITLINSMGNVFKALSDPTRREILKLLKKHDMSAGEISDCFTMSKPSISKHLDILREAELISSQKQGQFIIYSLNTTILQEALGEFLAFFEEESKWQRKS